MTIAIQASDLDHARIDGTRVYLKELLKRFGTLAPKETFLLYHRATFNSALAPPHAPNYDIRQLGPAPAWMQTRFALEMFRVRPDRLFLPIQAAPLVLPENLHVTATIHDLAFKRFPETFPLAHQLKLNFLLSAVVRRADRLICVSESTRHDLLEFFPHIAPSKVRVIHHGFDQDFFSSRLPNTEVQAVLSRFALSFGGYALYVGALQPRKNLIRLIEGFERAKAKAGVMKLVLAGEHAWLSQGIVKRIEHSPYRTDIIQTGRVTFQDVRALYQGARLFVFPSLYEGFGLPLLEAFASGIPVMTADNSSLREVAGEAALYVAAEKSDDIGEKMLTLWNDALLRTSLVEKGYERLTYFSWDRCAQETLSCILDQDQ